MSGKRGAGFTIIETMLFLGISGLLVMGILGGTSVAINAQRYRDATNSFLSFVQGEYDKVANVQNNRDLAVSCVGASITTSATSVTRGTTNCMIIGRLLTVSTDGATVATQPVYAAVVPTTSAAPTDTLAIQASQPFTSDIAEQPETYTPEWGTVIKLGDATKSRVLIVRSPTTGMIHTYVGSGTGTVLAMIVDSAKSDLKMCVDPKGLVVFGWSGAKIVSDASSQAGVKVAGDGEC